jgi:hypothetical protein
MVTEKPWVLFEDIDKIMKQIIFVENKTDYAACLENEVDSLVE